MTTERVRDGRTALQLMAEERLQTLRKQTSVGLETLVLLGVEAYGIDGVELVSQTTTNTKHETTVRYFVREKTT